MGAEHPRRAPAATCTPAHPPRLHPRPAHCDATLPPPHARVHATRCSSLDAAFQDLTQLMGKAEEMVQLAGYFRDRLRQPGGGGGDEALDSDTALDLFQMGIVDPVTKESAGRGYHRQLARQVRGPCVGFGRGEGGGVFGVGMAEHGHPPSPCPISHQARACRGKQTH